MGVYIGQSTKICDRRPHHHYGRIPAGSVVVSGNTQGWQVFPVLCRDREEGR